VTLASRHKAEPPALAAGSPVNDGPAPRQRPGPDTERKVHSVLAHRNAGDAERAPVDGLIRTRYTLEVCVVCGHERVHTPAHPTSCPECGASARRSFSLYRDLREAQR
jgi:hypothetical protein